jgi:hypothetical protein
MHNIYLTKEQQQFKGKIDWRIKDPEAWDVMCEWWMSREFKAISEQDQRNQQSKSLEHYY